MARRRPMLDAHGKLRRWMLLLSLLLPLLTRTVAQDACTAFKGCTQCTAQTSLQCGYCGESGICAVGSSSGPTVGTCTAGWTFGAGGCTTDPCAAATTCKQCALWDKTMQCGWCQDSEQCLSGQASGPNSGPTCTIWSFLGCSPAAQCAAIPDCPTCLLSQFEGQQCGFCATTSRCSAGDGNGPFAAAAATCPNTQPNAWRWNAFESTYLQCYQQLPYSVQQPSFTTSDQMSFALLIAAWLLLIFLGIGFSGCCRVCHRWAPRAGEARKQLDSEALVDHADDDADHPRGRSRSRGRGVVDRECFGLCCDSLNSQCARLGFWCLNLLLLVLIVAGMGLDSWSVVEQQCPFVSSEDNPVVTMEGTLVTTVSLGGSVRRSSYSYSYDCADPSASSVAQSECNIHADSGLMTLILGILGSLAAFINFLIASSDLCCNAKAKRAGAVDGAVGLRGDAIDLVLAHKIKHPYSSLQWRLAVLTCIATLMSLCFWLCGAYVLSAQYLGGLSPGNSFYLLLFSFALAALLALFYRRAIRVTPREGYALDGSDEGDTEDDRDDARRSSSFSGDYRPPQVVSAAEYGHGGVPGTGEFFGSQAHAGMPVDISHARLGAATPSQVSSSSNSYQSFTAAGSQQHTSATGTPSSQLPQPLLASSPQKNITRSSFRGPLSPVAQQQLHNEEQQRIAQQQQQYAAAQAEQLRAQSPQPQPPPPARRPSLSKSSSASGGPPQIQHAFVPPPGFVLVPVSQVAGQAVSNNSRPASPGMFGTSPNPNAAQVPAFVLGGGGGAASAAASPSSSSAAAASGPGSGPPTGAWTIPAQSSSRHASSHRSGGVSGSVPAGSARHTSTGSLGLRGAVPPED